MNKIYYILTLEVLASSAEQEMDEIYEAIGVTAVELNRPGAEHAWLELYFETEVEAMIALKSLQGRIGIKGSAVRKCEPRDWQTFWHAHFKARDIGQGFKIVPEWEKDNYLEEEGRKLLLINPGLSFGTGDHFTTRFCLETLEHVGGNGGINSLIDIGTGSGILAIAGARLGCEDIRAFDNDEAALDHARENAVLNGVQGKIRYYFGDISDQSTEEPADVVCANLFYTLLAENSPAISRMTRKALILTGVREIEVDAISEIFRASGFNEAIRDGDGEWAGILLTRR